jgi:hypothetical protein
MAVLVTIVLGIAVTVLFHPLGHFRFKTNPAIMLNLPVFGDTLWIGRLQDRTRQTNHTSLS